MRESLIKNKLQVLHFVIQNMRLCVELQYVDKILPLVWLEAIPGSPLYFVGMINYAGKSVPVIDLAIRLGLNRSQSYSLDTPIILCSAGIHQTGMIVDKIISLTWADTDLPMS